MVKQPGEVHCDLKRSGSTSSSSQLANVFPADRFWWALTGDRFWWALTMDW
jgi:hypothetical protein